MTISDNARQAAEKMLKHLDHAPDLRMAFEQATQSAIDASTEAECARWQNAIYELCCAKLKDLPDVNIDGKGCDSGDPLDFTLSEISQAINAWQSATADKDAVIAGLREAAKDMATALLRASIASCNCSTKTPDPEYHAESCDYKVYRLALLKYAAALHPEEKRK